jgi:hypothetical protein
VKWLFKDRFALGKLTILDGDPGLGKSTVLVDIAARVSSHGIMPDGSQGITGHVLILSAEDDPEDTIRPRLELAGANLARCHFLNGVIEPDGEEHLPRIPEDLKAIEDAIIQTGAKLVIIDPLTAFLGKVDANTDQSIRQALYRLSKIAARHGCAIICQRHLNKGSSAKAMYRGGGSIAIIGHARSAFLCAVDPDDDTKRLLAPVKVNRGQMPPTLRFTLEPMPVVIDGQQDTICRIAWLGTSHHKADELVAPPLTESQKEEKEETKTKTEQARNILETLLADGPKEIAFCKAEAAKANVSNRTLERAAKTLGVSMKLETDDDGKNRYLWEW